MKYTGSISPEETRRLKQSVSKSTHMGSISPEETKRLKSSINNEIQPEDVGDLTRSGVAIEEKVSEPGFIEGLKESGRRQLSDPMAYVAGATRGLDAFTGGGVKQSAALLKSLHPDVDYDQAIAEQQQFEKEDFDQYPLLTVPSYVVGTATSPINKLLPFGKEKEVLNKAGALLNIGKTAGNTAVQTALTNVTEGNLKDAPKNLSEGFGYGAVAGGGVSALGNVVAPVIGKTLSGGGKFAARTIARSSPEAVDDYLALDKATRQRIGRGEVEPIHKIGQRWEDEVSSKASKIETEPQELSNIVSQQPGKVKGQDLLRDLEDEKERFITSREGVINNPEDAKYISWLDTQIQSFEAPEHLAYQEALESVGPEQLLKYKQSPGNYKNAPNFNEIAQDIESTLTQTKKGVSDESGKSFDILINKNINIPKSYITDILNRAKDKLIEPTEAAEISRSAIDDTLRRIEAYKGDLIRGEDVKKLVQETQAKSGFGLPPNKWASLPEKSKRDLQYEYNELLKADPDYRAQMEKTSELTDFYNRATKEKLLPLEERKLTQFLPKVSGDTDEVLRKSKEYIGQLGEKTGKDYLSQIQQASEGKKMQEALQKAGYTMDEIDNILSKINNPNYPELSASRVFEMLPQAEKHGVGDIFEKRIASPEYMAKKGEFTNLKRSLEDQKQAATGAAGIESIGKGIYSPRKTEGTRALDKLTQFDEKNATDWAKQLRLSALRDHFKSDITAGSRSEQLFANLANRAGADGWIKQAAAFVGAANDVYGRDTVRKALDIVADIEQMMSTGRVAEARKAISNMYNKSGVSAPVLAARELYMELFPPQITQNKE